MSGDPLHCRHCDQVFDTLDGFESHMVAKHPDSRPAGERPGSSTQLSPSTATTDAPAPSPGSVFEPARLVPSLAAIPPSRTTSDVRKLRRSLRVVACRGVDGRSVVLRCRETVSGRRIEPSCSGVGASRGAAMYDLEDATWTAYIACSGVGASRGAATVLRSRDR